MSNFETIKNIAYLGPQNSFSESAKDKFCEKHNLENCFTTPLTTIKQIVEYVEKNPNTVGILPVENTLDGTIRESLDCLMNSKNENLKIISEIILPIEYCLLSKTTDFYSITGLVATPRLISKCHEFIQNELPRQLDIIESPSMIDSAIELRNHNLTYASIGNKKIAQSCMLNILK
jgi:prephenate dehydratase